MKGRAQCPPSSMSTPTSRRALIIVPMGRCRALSCAVRVTSPRAKPASPATNRITVPAWPQSTSVEPSSGHTGVMTRSSPYFPRPGVRSTPTPSVRRASIILAESSECSGAASRLGPSANAARISSRLVRDFDPGTVTEARSGPPATGARQRPRTDGVGTWEYRSLVIGFYPTETLQTTSRTGAA